jgi:hypothetical protein
VDPPVVLRAAAGAAAGRAEVLFPLALTSMTASWRRIAV